MSRAVLIAILGLVIGFIAYNVFAGPRLDRDVITHLGAVTFTEPVSIAGGQSFSGLSDVSGDALCISGAEALGTCASAVFTTSVSTPALISPLTGGADDIAFKPAGTLAMTVAEGGNVTVVGDITVSGNDITLLNVNSAATGSADDILIKPAGATKFTLAEAGDFHLNVIVTSHGACAADADTGRIENYGVGNTISMCACEKTGVATYAWKPLSGTGTC